MTAFRPRYSFSLRTLFIATSALMLLSCFAIWATREPEGVSAMPHLHGLSQIRLLSDLGQPIYEDGFPLSRALGEFRIELLNFYPPSNPANQSVLIRELWWKDGKYNITVWFHQVNGVWIALDTCRWHEDVRF